MRFFAAAAGNPDSGDPAHAFAEDASARKPPGRDINLRSRPAAPAASSAFLDSPAFVEPIRHRPPLAYHLTAAVEGVKTLEEKREISTSLMSSALRLEDDLVAGIYSGRHYPDFEKAQLGIVWKRRVIEETVPGGGRVNA